ncbi:rod shape-determining protein MreD [Croceibacterium sp. TMG7-5b_MA50]|uniref:rod shape-determining protein MreD n=1 Tax=Croceibacterium sp. TMG7-5b_MA50 TaxID=3121290 RepID=UPI003221B198
MIDLSALTGRGGAESRSINRTQSPIRAFGVPWSTIMLGSLTPWLPVIAPAPIMPPLGYMLLLCWRLGRSNLLPLWAGFPLGLFDDLYSGQPFGSGILLFSLTLIAIDLIEIRFPWRSFWVDWLTAVLLLMVYLAATTLFARVPLTELQAQLVGSQLLFCAVLFPIIAWLVAALDRVRLKRVRRID